ncbi:helix-turn-helix transcriptional regulator [Cohnella nanjingensis]|uniref:AraC family transcriptional regulator n=1 Tax=Cohnella nanjingensis TaxID=1387779 RepID=A0A7X0VCX6_9BACL|nr:AraC family transcriptional regulator [Cohnella nanjingensis]MBB6669101.1 AraC family transcriptional regulator [Cohnella nanjingensis]
MKRDYQLNKDFPIQMTCWVPSSKLAPFHWHHSFEIGYCLEGEGQFYFEDKRYDVRAGDVFVVGNMEKHRAVSDPARPSRFYFVKFDASLIGSADNELLVPFLMKTPQFVNKIGGGLPAAIAIGRLMHGIWEELQAEERAHRSMIKGLLMQACTRLVRHYATALSPEEWARSLQAYKKLSPALDCIHARYHEHIQLKDIAASLSLSTSRTYHLFKETMGEGFKDYLTKIRVHEAKKGLADPNLSITDIYLSCGFQGHAAFYRAFQQIVGLTPKAYRQYVMTK